MTTYYFFDEYGNCFAEKEFYNDGEASEFAEMMGAEYFCTD